MHNKIARLYNKKVYVTWKYPTTDPNDEWNHFQFVGITDIISGDYDHLSLKVEKNDSGNKRFDHGRNIYVNIHEITSMVVI